LTDDDRRKDQDTHTEILPGSKEPTSLSQSSSLALSAAQGAEASQQAHSQSQSMAGSAVGDEPAPAQSTDLVGRTLGKFAIVERLGRGGSADVYRAEQQALGRSAVIKVLRTDIRQTPQRVERFLREATLAARLDHPYAAHIYAFGVEPDGLMWIAMEFVRGTTLDELVARRGPLPPTVFAPLFERLCEVVHGAHELGVIHRDIKLANVMVIERSGQLLPKLLDFGIAKATAAFDPGDLPDGALDPTSANVTSQGATIGSPPYMAPEQWSDPGNVDRRADIYALAVLCHRCLTGHPPLWATTRADWAQVHLYAKPAALAAGPPALSEAVGRALAKDRDQRYPSALDFAAAVRKAVGAGAAESLPLLDGMVRDVWERGGPQPLAEAVAKVAAAATTVEVDSALRALIDVACRWLAAVALAGARNATSQDVRERTAALWGRDDAAAWLDLATAACAARPALPELPAMIAATAELRRLAGRGGRGRTSAELSADVGALAAALGPLEPLLAYRLVVGGETGPEAWMGVRQPSRPRVLLWGEAVAVGEVVLLDGTGRIALRLTPLVRAQRPLPHADLELFVIWRTDKGAARLAAAPWGYERDDEEAGLLLAALGTTDTDTFHDALEQRSPYPGLAAYGVDDAGRFFGREREIDALANRLVRAPLVAVVGPSGVGKSSFVHAGLAARLRDQYTVLSMRPGRHPVAALCEAIAAHTGRPCPEAAVVRELTALGEEASRGCALVVDQLEELSTLAGDPAEATRFAQLLAGAAHGPSAPVRIVATLRDDFASVLESIDGLRGRFEVFVLATPPPEALRRILIEPARRAAVAIEGGLVEQIVGEVAGRAAALPLLSFTAARLWATRDTKSRLITRAAYDQLGGVAGALARYADEVYANLGKREQQLAREVFARLVARDGTRVPVARSELAALDAGTGALDRLIEARLLVVRDGEPEVTAGGDAGAASDDDLVEIVHECLAERWPRLVRWRSEEASDRAALDDLRAAARRWYDGGRRPDLLWRGQAVGDLRRLLGHNLTLADRELRFADACIQAERRAGRRRRNLVVGALVVMGAVAAVMALLMVAARRSRTQATASAGQARAAASLAEQRLASNLYAQGRRELGAGAWMTAAPYLAEAARRGIDDPGLHTLLGLLARAWAGQRLADRDPALDALVAPPHGRWVMALAGRTGVARWWDPAGRPSGTHSVPGGAGQVLGASADGSTVFIGHVGGVTALRPDDEQHRELAIDPVPRAMWSGPGVGELTLVYGEGFDVVDATGARRPGGRLDLSERTEVMAAPGGVGLVSLDRDRGVVLTRTDSGDTHVLVEPAGAVGQVLITPTRILTIGEREVRSFDPDGAGRARWAIDRPRLAAVSASDDALVVLTAGNQLERFTLDGERQGVAAVDGAGVTALAVGPGGASVWVGDERGVVRHLQHGRVVDYVPALPTAIAQLALTADLAMAFAPGAGLTAQARSEPLLRRAALPCSPERVRSHVDAVVLGCPDGRVLAWLAGPDAGPIRIPADADGVSRADDAVAYQATTHRLAVGVAHGVVLLNPRGELTARLELPRLAGRRVDALAFRADGNLVVAYGGQVLAWNVATPHAEPIAAEALATERATALAVVGDLLVVGTEAGELLALEGDRITHQLTLGLTPRLLAVSADDRHLLAGADERGSALVEVSTWSRVRQLPMAAPAVFAAGGALLATADRGELVLLDTATGIELVRTGALGSDLRLVLSAPGGDLLQLVGDDDVATLVLTPAGTALSDLVGVVACHAPLAVRDGALEPTAVRCQ
jgi:tRNA A-37 threonylcarbamoyl transferase component Bud32